MAVLLMGLALLPVGFAAPETAGSEAEAGPSPAESVELRKPRTGVQDQLARLIRKEAEMARPSLATEGDKTEVAEGTLELEPMIVDGKRETTWPPPLRENKVQEILRTGTLAERVGPRFTKRFWVKGDQGVGFTLAW
jgi:hypothetical protein